MFCISLDLSIELQYLRVVTLSELGFLVYKQDINITSLCVLRLCLAADNRGQMAVAQPNRSLFSHGTSSSEMDSPGLVLLFEGLTEDLGSFCLAAQICRATRCLLQFETK